MKYFDAHCHIQFDAYDADREEVILQMREAEVGGLVVGTDWKTSEDAAALTHGYENGRENLYASVGLHPNHAEQTFDHDSWRVLATYPKVMAIGECGLDNFRPEDPKLTKARQHEVFLQHVELALELNKPLMIHSRPSKGTQDAYRDTIDILRSYKKEHGARLRGDMHFFVGGIDEARDFIDLGFTLSYTAVLTFARDYDDVVRFAPLTSLLTETDSPYIAPASRRGQRNDPLSIPAIVEAMAQIRGEEVETVREAVLANAMRLFSRTK